MSGDSVVQATKSCKASKSIYVMMLHRSDGAVGGRGKCISCNCGFVARSQSTSTYEGHRYLKSKISEIHAILKTIKRDPTEVALYASINRTRSGTRQSRIYQTA